jgi:hypothetical protein
MGVRQLLALGATAIAVAAAGTGPDSHPGPSTRGAAARATIVGCGRVMDTHYSFRVISHGARAPSCRTARRVARRAVGRQIEHPVAVPGWSCTADYYYDGPWSFLCIRRRTFGQVSVDSFRASTGHRTAVATPPGVHQDDPPQGELAERLLSQATSSKHHGSPRRPARMTTTS